MDIVVVVLVDIVAVVLGDKDLVEVAYRAPICIEEEPLIDMVVEIFVDFDILKRGVEALDNLTIQIQVGLVSYELLGQNFDYLVFAESKLAVLEAPLTLGIIGVLAVVPVIEVLVNPVDSISADFGVVDLEG